MDFEGQAHLLKLVGHPVRLRILEALMAEPSCVQHLNELLDCSQPNLSQHMKALKEAGLVDCRKEGAKRCYFICRPSLVGGLLTVLGDDHAYQICRRLEERSEPQKGAERDRERI